MRPWSSVATKLLKIIGPEILPRQLAGTVHLGSSLEPLSAGAAAVSTGGGGIAAAAGAEATAPPKWMESRKSRKTGSASFTTSLLPCILKNHIAPSRGTV